MRPYGKRGKTLAWIEDLLAAEPTDECINGWPYSTCRGYPQLRIEGRLVRAAHIVLERTGRPRPEEVEACHTCGNNPCLNPRHLRWDTHAANMADRVAHGTANRGERHGMSVLTEEQVREIRASKESARTLGDRFGVSEWAIYKVRSGRSWGWLS